MFAIISCCRSFLYCLCLVCVCVCVCVLCVKKAKLEEKAKMTKSCEISTSTN